MTQRDIKDKKPLNTLKLKLKKLEDQVIVLTGATSGIGLVTARMAAQEGARLVLADQNKEALDELAEELKSKGAQVVTLAMDVSKETEVNLLAQQAIEEFGGFDTWINNAAVAIYGHLTDVPVEDARLLFETNYWGTVYGSLAAVRHFKEKNSPSALINMGSVLGNRTFPIQGTYSSSKHAVHSFTDALRMELEKDNQPIVVSQIHPARIDTPYPEHAASYIDRAPSHDGMMYPPESVAESILHAAQHPVRDMYVGGQSKMISLMGALMPRVTDKYLEKSVYDTNYDEHRPALPPESSTLYGNGRELHERGNSSGWRRKGSWMVKFKKHPLLFIAPAVGLVAVTCLVASKNNKKAGKFMKMSKNAIKGTMAAEMVKHPKKAVKAKATKEMAKHPKKAMEAKAAVEAVKHPKKAMKAKATKEMAKHPKKAMKVKAAEKAVKHPTEAMEAKATKETVKHPKEVVKVKAVEKIVEHPKKAMEAKATKETAQHPEKVLNAKAKETMLKHPKKMFILKHPIISFKMAKNLYRCR